MCSFPGPHRASPLPCFQGFVIFCCSRSISSSSPQPRHPRPSPWSLRVKCEEAVGREAKACFRHLERSGLQLVPLEDGVAKQSRASRRKYLQAAAHPSPPTSQTLALTLCPSARGRQSQGGGQASGAGRRAPSLGTWMLVGGSPHACRPPACRPN